MKRKGKKSKGQLRAKKKQSRIFNTGPGKSYMLKAKVTKKGRRQTKKSAPASHVLHMVVLGIAVLVVGLGGWQVMQYLKNSPVFTIDVIEVKGSQVFSPEEIMEISGIEPQVNFFDVHIYRIKKHLLSQPSIKDAVISKNFESVTIEIDERVPLATVKQQGITYYVDAEGMFFTLNLAPTDRFIPRIDGLHGVTVKSGETCANDKLQNALRVLQLYSEYQLSQLFIIERVEIHSTDDIILRTASGQKLRKNIRIHLGNRDLGQKLAELEEILQTPVVNRISTAIDLRGSKPSMH